jgi:hypothetical protein
MYISIFYVVTQSFVKNGYILCPVQKRQKRASEKAYFSIKFCYFYIDRIKSWFLLKQLCRHIQHGNVHKTFLFQIL